MRINSKHLQSRATPSKEFTRSKTTDFHHSDRPVDLHADTVYLLRPPRSLSSDSPWIISPESTAVLRHPLTSKPHLFNLPRNFDFRHLHPSAISRTFHFHGCDKLVVFPEPGFSNGGAVKVSGCTFLALYGGGELLGSPRRKLRWGKVSHDGTKFDDVIVYDDQIYAVDRQGRVNLINSYRTKSKISIGKTLISDSGVPSVGRFGLRKRFAVDGGSLYLVVRTAERSFGVYMLQNRRDGAKKEVYWEEVRKFEGDKVLFMARDHYFFREATERFPGKEYMNCIVFSEAAFPQYGKDGWEFCQTARQLGFVRKCEDDVAVFRLGDRCFGREGENSSFPKINWSPPAWVFRASSIPADEFKGNSELESSSQSERELDEVKGVDSGSSDENDGEVQSDSKDSNSKDEEEQEVMKSDFNTQDHRPEVVEIDSDSNSQDQDDEVVEIIESDSDNQDQEDGKMQCDSNTREKENEEMHSKVNIQGDASLQEDIVMVMPSLSAIDEEATKTLLSMTSGIDAVGEETSVKQTTHLIPKACTSSTTESHKGDSATTKFEGLDIRSDLVPTLQKIWQKHGNVIKDSIVRSGDIIARALESLATMVQILEDNSAQSLSDSQADYLSSTLSDLKYIRFQVQWLSYFVEKALTIRKSKALVESLNNLSQLSSQVKKRKAIVLDELTKLDNEENKLKEEMAKVSKKVPLFGKVRFDEPIGVGLT